ncbi:hypothetical protein B0H10DRAFT_2237405 [Mycena sp. CBHHK59/15]|nr:hypothetical protein B0H10DRAFT_2237405 [Mycena sp. CBHHK59/15]
MISKMLEYRKEDRSHKGPPSVQIPPTATRHAVNLPSASRAARAQTTGFARLNALAKSLSGSDLDPASDPSPMRELTEQEKAEAERRAVAEDERIVDEELGQYEAELIIDESSPQFEDLDLLRYWEPATQKPETPRIYSLNAPPGLPTQQQKPHGNQRLRREEWCHAMNLRLFEFYPMSKVSPMHDSQRAGRFSKWKAAGFVGCGRCAWVASDCCGLRRYGDVDVGEGHVSKGTNHAPTSRLRVA